MVRSAASHHQAIAVTIEAVNLDHIFERIHQPDVRDAFPSEDRQLALSIDALASGETTSLKIGGRRHRRERVLSSKADRCYLPIF